MFVIGYGSTLSLGSLAQTYRGFAANALVPIRVSGWARGFCVPSRTWEGLVLGVWEASAVANGFNGVLIEVPDDQALVKMDSREANYNRVFLDPESVTLYRPGRYDVATLARARQEGIWLYVPKPEKISYQGEISWPYVRVCLSGAQNFGAEFVEEFLQFTEVGAPDAGAAELTLSDEGVLPEGIHPQI